MPVVLGVLLALLFLRQFDHLHRHVWSDPKYSHAYLVPLVSAFWLWWEQDRVRALPREPSWWGLPVVLAGIGLWFAFLTRYPLNVLAHAAMMVTLVGTVLYAGGLRFLRGVAFPVFYLLFIFPVPKHLDTRYVVVPLQGVAAGIATFFIDLVGIPVIRDENIIDVPGKRLFVNEACSGIHSLYSLIAVGAFFLFFTRWRTWERIVLLAVTVPVAVAANVLRVTVTGIIAYHGSAEWITGAPHMLTGLAVFLTGLALFLGVAALLRRVAGPLPEGESP
jgi:exosortase